LKEIGPLLFALAREEVRQPVISQSLDQLKLENEFVTMERNIQDMGSIGKPSAFTCPSCHGCLWEMQDGKLVRFRCHTGHAFSPESLLAEQSEALEESLFSATRALNEKAAAMRSLAQHFAPHVPSLHAEYLQKAAKLEGNADVIREMIASHLER
jgi:two-component system chemotaxis response regulator CheB